jgi:cardiolipin synthase
LRTEDCGRDPGYGATIVPQSLTAEDRVEEYLVSLLDPGEWFAVFTGIVYLLACVAAVDILRRPREPMAMLAWILGIFLLPVFGLVLYYSIGERRVMRRARRKRRKSEPIRKALGTAQREGETGMLRLSPGSGEAGPPLPTGLEELAGISAKLADSSITLGNQVEVYTTAKAIYDDILKSIEEARSHVHLEYYIFRPDDTGRLFRDLLIRKAREGVEVRLLIDGIGSFWTRTSFLRPLVDAGAKVATFLPAVPFRRSWHINSRNHRKIVVVDGERAHTGSQNIGDEYRGALRRLGPWKDTHLRVEGPAARGIQEVFIEDWYFATGEDLCGPSYLKRTGPRGDSLVQVIPSGPDQPEGILPHIFFAAIALARSHVRISTPYFVPNQGLLFALQHAAYRGVRVDLVIPSRSDAKLALWAGRSYYQQLLRAGVKVHEYPHGMLHSKSIVIDDRWCMVGSANMDMRSFLLNFELTVCIFDGPIAHALAEDFEKDRTHSRPIPIATAKHRPPLSAVLEGAARLLSPLL